MISAINSLSMHNSPKKVHKKTLTSARKEVSVGGKKMIRHAKPQFSRSEVLDKIKKREEKKSGNIGMSSKNQAMKITPPKDGLASPKEDSDITQSKLKKLLSSSGAIMFSQKERDVLAKILK